MAGSILFLALAPGVVAGVVPWLLTRCCSPGANHLARGRRIRKLVADRQHDLPELLARLHPLVSGARVGEWEDLVDDRACTA